MSFGGHAGLQYGIGKGTYPVVYHENNVHLQRSITPQQPQSQQLQSQHNENFVGYRKQNQEYLNLNHSNLQRR